MVDSDTKGEFQVQVFICSDYLDHRERIERVAARDVLARSGAKMAPTDGFFKRLLRWLFGSGDARAERLERMELRQAAAEHEIEAERWARGREGEELVTAVLARRLDDRYVLLRNYTPSWPYAAGGDIDALLLGPHGVTVFEIKAWRGEYRCRGEEWWWRPYPNADWQEAMGNPVRQALANAERIRAVLREAGMRGVHVQPMVAVADEEMRVEIAGRPAAYIFRACDPHAPAPSFGRGMRALPDAVLQRVYTALVAPLYARR
jgi:hypothetical protein